MEMASDSGTAAGTCATGSGGLALVEGRICCSWAHDSLEKVVWNGGSSVPLTRHSMWIPRGPWCAGRCLQRVSVDGGTGQRQLQHQAPCSGRVGCHNWQTRVLQVLGSCRPFHEQLPRNSSPWALRPTCRAQMHKPQQERLGLSPATVVAVQPLHALSPCQPTPGLPACPRSSCALSGSRALSLGTGKQAALKQQGCEQVYAFKKSREHTCVYIYTGMCVYTYSVCIVQT